jgi:hypothetical protein
MALVYFNGTNLRPEGPRMAFGFFGLSLFIRDLSRGQSAWSVTLQLLWDTDQSLQRLRTDVRNSNLNKKMVDQLLIHGI